MQKIAEVEHAKQVVVNLTNALQLKAVVKSARFRYTQV
jgi:hypothetical protein